MTLALRFMARQGSMTLALRSIPLHPTDAHLPPVARARTTRPCELPSLSMLSPYRPNPMTP